MSAAPAPERLLVLAPTGRDAELATAVLAREGLDARACRDAGELCREIAAGAAAVLVTEEALSPATVEAIAAVVAAQEPWSDLPIVVFASRPGAAESAGAPDPLAALGNVTVVDRPLRRRTLASVARAALRARRRQYAARGVLAQLREAVRQRDHFLALLGHELRNPLAAIDSASEVLARGADPERPLAVVRRQTRQLARLVDDLLDVSRVTSGKVVLRTASVDVRDLARRAVESYAPAAARASIAVTLLTNGPVHVEADEARLEQVLTNLIANALKYTPRNGHVVVRVAEEDGHALLSVRDDGIGIEREDLARVFEPFVQVSAAIDRARGGMGLGLTLARSLVEMHGGTLEGRSDGRGRGSEFIVRLPAASPPRARSSQAARDVVPRDVLVVEDGEDVRESFSMALELAGHTVRAAPDGPTALALARERPPEVAFVDVGLPLMDGYEVARRLRAEHGAAPFLVALTGYGQPEDRELATAAGFDVHVTKPADLAAVEAMLRRLRGA